MALPIELAKIHWSGIGIAEFQVRGQQAIKDLLAHDPTATVNIDQQAQLSYDLASTKVELIIHVQMQALAGQPVHPIGVSGNFEFHLFFEVENLPDLLLTSEEQPGPVMPPQLALMLTGIAYSTLRGILWTRLSGTPLEGISLPIIEPRSLLQSPLKPAPIAPVKRSRKHSPPSGKK